MNLDTHGLVAAAQSNDLAAIRTAALQGATMLDADDQGHTALWYAAQDGRTETVQTLLDALPVVDLVAEQAHITACAAEAGRGGHAKALEVLAGSGAIDEAGLLQIEQQEGGSVRRIARTDRWVHNKELEDGPAREPARAGADQHMAVTTKRLPSSLELGSQRMDEMREAYKMEAWHAQQTGLSL